MARTKEDYADLGRQDAQVEAKSPYPRSSSSWQAAAYWEGRDAEMARLQVKEEVEWQEKQTKSIDRLIEENLVTGAAARAPTLAEQGLALLDEAHEGKKGESQRSPGFKAANALRKQLREQQDGRRIADMPGCTAGWPRAAAEHALRLAIEIKAEAPIARRFRMIRKLHKLMVKWGRLAAVHPERAA